LDALATNLFLEDGSLDMARFDAGAQTVFEAAIDCAQKKRYPVLGRRHLLYGMLVAEGGLLPKRVGDQGADAELLADQVNAAIDTGTSRVELLRPAYRTMSRDLVRILCQAERNAEEESCPLVAKAISCGPGWRTVVVNGRLSSAQRRAAASSVVRINAGLGDGSGGLERIVPQGR